jgi:hypothetical protein
LIRWLNDGCWIRKTDRHLNIVMSATLWILWKFRNSIIFQQAVWVDLDCPNFLGTKGFFLVVIERHGWYLRILWRQMRLLIDDKVCTRSEAAAGA